MGGDGPERQVSLRSGEAVAYALADAGHAVCALDTLKGGKPYFTRDREELKRWIVRHGECPIAFSALAPDITESASSADVTFIALHGGIGENGTLQAIFDAHGIKYCGSGPTACALAMDKRLTKMIYESAAIPTPPYTVFKKGDTGAVPPCYPCIVKPTNGGSSIGVCPVFSPIGLKRALSNAFSVCENVIIEKLISGRELSVSVLCDEPLAVTEIISDGFYGYENKYKKGGAREITPALVDKELYSRAMRIAKNAHRALGMRGFSRTDIMLDEETGQLYALETNAIPGMTETSILPSAAASRGISLPHLCELMLGSAQTHP